MNDNTVSLLNNLIDLLKIIIPLFVVSYLTYIFGVKKLKEQKRMDFIEKQINEFYSPLLGCRMKIQASGELRVEVQSAANAAWRKICANQEKPFTDHDKYFAPFKNIIEYDNNKFQEEILPLYNKMLLIFTEKRWLAEHSTEKYYSDFYKYIGMWHRWLDKAIPAEVLDEVDYKEEKLLPFYADLEQQIKLLKKKLSGD